MKTNFDYWKESGFLDRFKERYGITVNPIHDFEELKKTRLNLFKEQHSEDFNNLDERGKVRIYFEFLNNELCVIDEWFVKNKENYRGKKISSWEYNAKVEALEKYKEYVANEIKNQEQKLKPTPIDDKPNIGKITASHHALAYILECYATGSGNNMPIGKKMELERIGNERIGTGKGNRFYKAFNEIMKKDLNTEKNLFEIGGEYWRDAVIKVSKYPELVEKYLQSKGL